LPCLLVTGAMTRLGHSREIQMTSAVVRRFTYQLGGALAFAAMTACSGTGGLGNVLGSVLGGGAGQSNQLSGAIYNVDTRSQQIGVQQSNGQTVYVGYDANTQVVYQNQNYPVTALERGDQVVATLQDNGNGGYYVSAIQVTQSVNNSSGTVNGNVQTFQGTVRQVDRANGWFTVDEGSIGRITVTLPSGLSQADLNRFGSLRAGDYVRFYGTRASNAQVQLRQFY
jgi:hypothetical protein